MLQNTWSQLKPFINPLRNLVMPLKSHWYLLQGFIQAFSLHTVFVLKIQFYERGSVAIERVFNSWGPGGAVSSLVVVEGAKPP